jgi:hypothetical protein
MSKRIAACFGLNYAGLPFALNGCVNDATMMRALLEKKGYTTSLYVTNADTTASRTMSVLFNMAMSTWSDPTITNVWVYYAGHGTQVPDADRDESDGLDEAIVPSDCRTAGVINDDQLYRLLQCFNPKCIVTLFFDCCHSGSMCDLPYSYTTNGASAKSPISKLETNKKALRGKVRVLSGCLDHQTAAEASGLSGDKQVNGAATVALSDIVSKNANPSWLEIGWLLDARVRQMGVLNQRAVTSSSTPLTRDDVLF